MFRACGPTTWCLGCRPRRSATGWSRPTGTSVHDPQSLVAAIGKLFEHFVGHGARACAVLAPSRFHAGSGLAGGGRAAAFDAVWRQGAAADAGATAHAGPFRVLDVGRTLAEFQLPFDLMIGVERGVYAAGVHQGRDLYDSRVSLIQYRELLNAFPQVTFPISVLASVTNQELVSYSWIFPNVVTCGHWWYSNTPALHRARSGGAVWKQCRGRSKSATTATCTSSNSAGRSSPCTNGAGQSARGTIRDRSALERGAGTRPGRAMCCGKTSIGFSTASAI